MMKIMFRLVYALACIVAVSLAEPEESEGAIATSLSSGATSTPASTPAPTPAAPQASTPTTQNTSSAGLLDSLPLTPANQVDGAPLDDMLENINQSNTTLRAAMGFAKDGDYESALGLFAQSCEQGNAAGCFGTGLIYMYGANNGMPQPQKAVDYYYKACVGGDAVACANLAMAYDNGQGVKEDKDQAAQLYEVACQGGDSLGCTNIGWMYANGVGVKKDYQKALALYNRACQLGSDLGCYNLGLMSNTYNIYGMTKDTMSYVEMNYVACQQGDIVGCGNLGWMYATGSNGADKSYYNAAKYFTIACDSGHIQSCNNLGVLYDGGFGVRQDKRKALELFGLACDYGLESGCENYSLMKTKGSVSSGSSLLFGIK